MDNKDFFKEENFINENKKINNLNNFKEENLMKKELNEIRPKKKEVIDEINQNFRTVLSYGTANELVPAGQFIVKDIVLDPNTGSKNLILEQIDNPSINLIVPQEAFKRIIEMAMRNSKKLKIDESPIINPINKVIQDISQEIISDEFLTNLHEVDVLPLEDNNITLIRDGIETPANYSVCPLHIEPLQRYLEKTREIIYGNDPKKPGSTSNRLKLNIEYGTKKELEEEEEAFPDIILEPGPFHPELELEQEKKSKDDELER